MGGPECQAHVAHARDRRTDGRHGRRALFQQRQGGQQLARVGMGGMPQHLLRRAGLLHAPAVHDRHARAHALDQPDVVADEDHAQAALHPQLIQQVQDAGFDRDVERGGRLVEQQQVGRAGQRRGDHDALLHAAGQLVRIGVQQRAGARQAHLVHQPQRFGARGAGIGAPALDQRLGDLAADRQAGVERGEGILEHHGDAVAAQPGGAFARDVLAVEDHAAGGDRRAGRQQAQHRPGNRALARAALAHDAQRCAARQRQIHAMQHLVAAVAHAQALDIEDSVLVHLSSFARRARPGACAAPRPSG
ncbi:Uncharacterised protein [Bordetella pertussis]|nr:Uncharacterised protein [Bordetella pertussis]